MNVQKILQKFEWMTGAEYDVSEYIMKANLRLIGNIERNHQDLKELVTEIMKLTNMMSLMLEQIIKSTCLKNIYIIYKYYELSITGDELQIIKLTEHYLKTIAIFENYYTDLYNYIYNNGEKPRLKK